MSFGKRLRNYRKQHDLSQAALADRLKIARSTISQYENGSRTPDEDTVHSIAQTLGLEPEYFFSQDKTEEIFAEDEDELNFKIRDLEKHQEKIKQTSDLIAKKNTEFKNQLQVLISTQKELVEIRNTIKNDPFIDGLEEQLTSLHQKYVNVTAFIEDLKNEISFLRNEYQTLTLVKEQLKVEINFLRSTDEPIQYTFEFNGDDIPF